MKKVNLMRGLVVAVPCLMLAVLLGLQSASIFLTRKAPDRSVSLFSLNGLAHENLASAFYTHTMSGEYGTEFDEGIYEGQALEAYKLEPLSPEALAILALSLPEDDQRRQFVQLASQLNRRNQKLLGVELREHVRANDYAESIDTLDKMLTVRPSRGVELFPILMEVFSQKGAVDEFQKVLTGDSPWHLKFLRSAANNDKALQNLAILRTRISFREKEVDQALIRNLARRGDLKSAFTLYNQISKPFGNADQEGILAWTSSYPPLDWSFASDRDFRAQPALDTDALEVYIRPGKGGEIARRIIAAPLTPTRISVKHGFSSGVEDSDVTISLKCNGKPEPFITKKLAESPTIMAIESFQPNCDYLEIAMTGRVWTGRPALRGVIEPLVFE